MNFLVIDDSQDALRIMNSILSKFGNCVPIDNGEEGIQRFLEAHENNDPFHLVFLDILMPDMDGHEVLLKIRQLEKQRYPDTFKVKIAMLTAVTNTKNRFSSFREGCDYFVSKPFIKSEIIEIVSNTKEWFFDVLGS